LFTPAPWRLVTDTAIWSENWPGIPRPARGEVTFRYTNCALCPAGCAVRARSVNSQPVSLSGAAGHPLSHGALCAFGLTGHHLPYHPLRLKRGSATESEAAAAVAGAIAKRGPGEKVAVLDLLPGRAASATYRRAMNALTDGAYLAPPMPMGGAAVDLAKARTVLSLGVPLLDGWGTPGNVYAARAGFRLIQAEPYESPTAALADEWLPLKPGSEAAFALALAGKMPPADAALATGISEQRITDLASELRQNGPSLVLSAEDLPEVRALNQAIGAFGRTIVPRSSGTDDRLLSSASSLISIPDASIRVLFIDESVPGAHIPWAVIAKKLVPADPLVVAFAWSREGYGRHAQFVLPTAVYPELTTDIPTAIDSPVATFRLSAPLVAPPAGMTDPVAFIAKAAGIDPGNPLRERADAIQKAGKGTVFTPANGSSRPVKDLKPDDLWKALNDGATWFDDSVGRTGAPTAVVGPSAFLPESVSPGASPSGAAAFPLVIAFASARPATLASPLLSKLYQDSDLCLPPNTAALHPDTLRAAGMEGASRAKFETPYGACAINVAPDPAVPPGLLFLTPGPETLDICDASTRAKVEAI